MADTDDMHFRLQTVLLQYPEYALLRGPESDVRNQADPDRNHGIPVRPVTVAWTIGQVQYMSI